MSNLINYSTQVALANTGTKYFVGIVVALIVIIAVLLLVRKYMGKK